MDAAIRESGTRGLADGPDKAFRFAADMITRGEELGFETTLLAERWLGTDHPAWMLASALAPLTSRIELMVAVHPGIIAPQVGREVRGLARPHQRRPRGDQHRQRLVEGGVRDLRHTAACRRTKRRATAAWTNSCASCAGMWSEDEFEFHGEFYTSTARPAAQVGADAEPADLRRDPQRDRQGNHRARRRQLVRRLRSRLPEVGAEHRAGGGLHRRHEGARGALTAASSTSACRVMSSAPSSNEAAIETGQAARRARQDQPHRLHRAKALGAGLVGTPETIADRIRRYEAAGVQTHDAAIPSHDGRDGDIRARDHAAARQAKGGLTIGNSLPRIDWPVAASNVI